MKKRRINTHAIATNSTNIIRTIIEKDGDGLFREITGQNYGVNAIVEVFDEGCVTGKIAFIQCKGIYETIMPLKTDPNVVSCSNISAATIDYAEQNNTIIFIAYASSQDNSVFYYANLRDVLTDEHINKINNGQSHVTVRMPVLNNSRDNMDGFWRIINDFYEFRKKASA